MSSNRNAVIIGAVIGVLAAFLLLYNLSDRYMWGDEAETALLAKNITKFGLPKVSDGRNTVTLYGLGRDSNEEGLWTWSPWLDEYIAAGSILILGPNTLAARLPFALLGLACVGLMALFVHRIYRRPDLTVTAALLLLTNVAFLLHARQCRYYVLIVLAQILLFYGFHKLVTGTSPWRSGWIVLGLAIQFYSNYIVVPINVVVLPAAVILARPKSFKIWLHLLTGYVIFALLTLPWLLYAKPWGQANQVGASHFAQKIVYYLASTNHFVFPLILLIVPLAWMISKSFRAKSESADIPARHTLWLLGLFLPAILVYLGFVPGRYFRYILPALPMLVILAALIVTYGIPYKPLRGIVLALLILSNTFSAVPAMVFKSGRPLSSPLTQFVRSITTEYLDRFESVLEYFKKEGGEGRTAFVMDPEFPLAFYSDLAIMDGRFYPSLPTDLAPDYFLAVSASGLPERKPIAPPPWVSDRYEEVWLKVPATYRQANRPDPWHHRSFTEKVEEGFLIYRKVR